MKKMELNIQLFATILSNQQSTTGSPYVIYTVNVTPSARTINGVTLNVSVTANLKSSSSSLGTGSGYGLNGYLTVNGQELSAIAIKGTGTSWSGTTKHTVSKSYTISGLSVTQTSLTGIKFRVARTTSGGGGAGYLSSKSCSNIAISSFAAPSILNSFSISIANDETTRITPNITKYDSSFYDSLVVTAGGQTFTLSGVTNGSAVTLSTLDREKIFSAIGTSTYADISAYIKTGTSSSSPNDIGNSTSMTARATLPNYTLSVTATLTDLNNSNLVGGKAISTFKPNANTMIKNLSRPRITYKVTSSTGKMYGRKISTSNAISKSNLNSGDSFNLDLSTNNFNSSYVINVTDGRKSTSATTNINVVNYTLPGVTPNITRPNPTGSALNYSVAWNYYNGTGLTNLVTPTLNLRWKENKYSSYSSKSIDISANATGNNSGSLGTAFDYKQGAVLEATLVDRIGNTITITDSISSGQPVHFSYKDGNGDNHFRVYGDNTIDTNLFIKANVNIGKELKFTNQNISTNGLYYPNTKTHSDYNNNQTRLVTLNTLSFWNGAYDSSNGSNLTYCARGTIAALSDIPSVPAIYNSYSLNENGYVRFANGLQICWGSGKPTANGTPAHITFAKSFSNADYSIITSVNSSNGNKYFYSSGYNNKTATGVDLWSFWKNHSNANSNSGTDTVSYIAIGY